MPGVITNKETRMKYLFAVVIVLFVGAVSASQDTTAKVETLMRAQGLLDMWQEQIEMGKREGEKQAKLAIDQMLSQLNPNEEYRNRFEGAFMKFMDKMQGNWTAKQIVDVWASYYGPRFTEAELDQLIEFYTSDIGRKDVQATKETMVDFTQYFQREYQPIMSAALNEYIQDLKIVARECKCPKKR